MGFILVYVTHPNYEEARKVASHLLEKRLIACANFFPIRSVYWWHGKINHAYESVSIFKARTENWKKIKDEVKKVHRYEVPSILKISAQASAEYEQWIKTESRGMK
jgi:periplasmic divalent cation tolerance protein